MLSDAQWAEFGATMRRVHDVHIATDLWEQAPTVNYAASWRRDLRALLPQIEACDGDDELALALAGIHPRRTCAVHRAGRAL